MNDWKFERSLPELPFQRLRKSFTAEGSAMASKLTTPQHSIVLGMLPFFQAVKRSVQGSSDHSEVFGHFFFCDVRV